MSERINASPAGPAVSNPLVDAIVAAVAVPVDVMDDDVVALPPGWKIQDTNQFARTPRYISETVRHHDLASFSAYIGRQQLPETVVFIKPELSLTNSVFATAVIDYHGKRDAAWGKHRVEYVPRIHWAYALLVALQSPVPQQQFVEQLRKLERHVSSMRHADLIEMLRTLTVAVSGKISNVRDDMTGSLNFSVEKQQRGVLERTEQTLPSVIDFRLPVLMGQPERYISCDFRFDVKDKDGDQMVVFSLRIRDREGTEEEIIESIAESLNTLGVPVYRGVLV